jgi:LmbE family N-acetylglucosaminyl deacetylase
MVYEMAKEHAAQLPDGAAPDDFNPDGPADDGNPMGEPASAISHRVDVREYSDLKRKAISCHASQITDTNFLGNMSPEIFQMTFGYEWFTKIGESGPPRDAWLFD